MVELEGNEKRMIGAILGFTAIGVLAFLAGWTVGSIVLALRRDDAYDLFWEDDDDA